MKLSFRRKTAVPERGKLITVEGIDASGRNVQIKLLTEALTFAGFTVAVVEFPQNEGPVERLVKIQDKAGTREEKAIFHALDHREAREKILAWLEKGTIVIAKNYVVATGVHNSAESTDPNDQVKFFRWVNNLEFTIFRIPRPELTIILDMPAEIAQLLSTKASKGRKDLEFARLQLEALGFRHAARVHSQTRLVPCVYKGNLLTPQEIHNTVWQLVRRIVFKNKLS